jgi:hypothetical protein
MQLISTRWLPNFKSHSKSGARDAFARTASLAEAAAGAVEFEARCNALYDVLSMLTVPKVDKVQGALNLLQSETRRRRLVPELALQRRKPPRRGHRRDRLPLRTSAIRDPPIQVPGENGLATDLRTATRGMA